jgi:hypothetical protein
MTPECNQSTSRLRCVLATVVALFALLVGCTAHAEPALPPSNDPAAISDRVTGPDGQTFLREITSASWEDDGRRAADLFAWIPRDAPSTDGASAARAGKAAHAIASFLADDRESFATAPGNPALWQAYAQTLVPYLGAMVGDQSGVAGFEPLDGTGSQMRRTASTFAALTKNADAERIVTEGAAARARGYEAAFAKAAVAEPYLADRDAARTDFLLAARLRGLVAAASELVDPQSERYTVGHAQTELAYQVVSLTARPGDRRIEDKFFRDGRLLSPSEIEDADWSIYDTQLTVYLARSGRINDAINQFGAAYDVIA